MPIKVSAAPSNACSCEVCREGCAYKPGWFKPGELERLATNLELTPKEVFDRWLGLDFAQTSDGPVWVLSPRTVEMAERDAHVFPFEARGVCVFFENGRCKIHEEGKPFECASTNCQDDGVTVQDHVDVALTWLPWQDELFELLGYVPKQAEPTLRELMKMTVDYIKYTLVGGRI